MVVSGLHNNNNYGKYAAFARHRMQMPHTYRQESIFPVKKPDDPTSDGKFSILEYGKNIGKGVLKFIPDTIMGIVKNPLVSLPMLALGVAMASTPVGLTILAGTGILAVAIGGVFLGVKSASLAAEGKWDDLEKTGEELGKFIPAAALSTVGAFQGVRWLERASNAGKASNLGTSMKKAVNLSDFYSSFLKNIVCMPGRAFNRLIGRGQDNGIFLKPMGKDWSRFVGESSYSNGRGITGFLKEQLLSPRIKKRLFNKNERNYLLNVAKNPFSQDGILDITFGLPRRNIGQIINSTATAISSNGSGA